MAAAGSSPSGTSSARRSRRNSSCRDVAAKELVARLNGDNEVPGPGDSNGKGGAIVFPNVKKRRVWFEPTWEKHYANLHNKKYPGDAIRGQLKVK